MIIPLILLTLALIGLADAIYLTLGHLFDAGACAGSSCGRVLGSPHAHLLGIPVSGFGVGLYAGLLISAWRSLDPTLREQSVRWISLLSLLAALPTVWFLILQAFVIRAWCPFCVLSAVIILTTLAISLAWRYRTRSFRPFVGNLFVRDAIPVAAVLIILPLSLLPIEAGLARSPSESSLPDETVARIGNRQIRASEIDRAIHLKLYQARNGYRQEWLDRELLETAAKELGTDVRSYLQAEVYANIDITQEEIDKRYEEIKDRVPRNVPRESVLRNVRNEIANRKSKTALDAQVDNLMRRYGTVYRIPASERFVVDPNPRGGPNTGNPNAPVTIIEFSDLECRHCAKAHFHLKELLGKRSGEIRLIFRHLPLDMHPNAREAAEIAACAEEQNMFWPLVDILFSETDPLTTDRVMGFADGAGLDTSKLEACIDTGKGREIVEADIAEADALGLSSTPSFFVNGHYVGSLPKAGLEPVIQSELRSSGILTTQPH
jgi:uncharacterized membrane protein/predicted DsbA family dithiol-disulfide isomerase